MIIRMQGKNKFADRTFSEFGRKCKYKKKIKINNLLSVLVSAHSPTPDLVGQTWYSALFDRKMGDIYVFK